MIVINLGIIGLSTVRKATGYHKGWGISAFFKIPRYTFGFGFSSWIRRGFRLKRDFPAFHNIPMKIYSFWKFNITILDRKA